MRLANPFASLPDIPERKSLCLRRFSPDISEGIVAVCETRSDRPIRTSFRTIVVALCMLGGLLLLVSRVFALQVASRGDYRLQAEGNRIRTEVELPPRGIFSDRYGTPLVRNEPKFDLMLNPGYLPQGNDEQRDLATRLSALLDTSTEDLLVKFQDAQKPSTVRTPLTLAEDLPYQDALYLSVRGAEFHGVSLHITAKRVPADAESLSHLLGYVGKISTGELEGNTDYSTLNVTGKTGTEKTFEDIVRGRNGRRFVEQNNVSRVQRVIAATAPEPGKNVTLTIDAGLQQVLFRGLKRSIEAVRSPGGAAVALDPRTGEVLALVSYPSYDAAALADGLTEEEFRLLEEDARHPFLFRPLMGEYPSGSTIKPVIAAAGLQEGVITERTTVESVGGIRINEWFFPDWKSGGHGTTNVLKALAESVNTFFYLVGGGGENFTGLGVKRITDYARRFGLGNRLGIDLPGEAAGFLPSREWKERMKGERWYIGDTYHLAIGQGDLLVTPLQVASYTATIANGGTLYRPHVLKSVNDSDGRRISEEKPEPIRKSVVDAQYLAVVRQGLRQAVTAGSARALTQLPVTAAGKTGTAQAPQGNPHAWFTAFAPYESPEIVITVLVENGGEGGTAALPVARDALAWYFTHTEQSKEEARESVVENH